MTVQHFPERMTALHNARIVARSDADPLLIADACDVLEWHGEWGDVVTARQLRRTLGPQLAAQVNAETAAAEASMRALVVAGAIAILVLTAVASFLVASTVLATLRDLPAVVEQSRME